MRSISVQRGENGTFRADLGAYLEVSLRSIFRGFDDEELDGEGEDSQKACSSVRTHIRFEEGRFLSVAKYKDRMPQNKGKRTEKKQNVKKTRTLRVSK
jgi:hypothetical protein